MVYIPTQGERALTIRDAIAIGVGATIGPGIFSVIGPLINLWGSMAPFAFIITGGALFFTVFAHAKMGVMFPNTGGLYMFGKHAFGIRGGFFMGWGFCISAAAAGAFVSLGFANYMNNLITVPRVWTGAALILFYVFLNLFNLRIVLFLQKIIVCTTISIILLVIGPGFFHGQPIDLTTAVPPLSQFLQGALLTFTLFAGFEVVGSMAGEIKNPSRNLPISMFGTLLLSTLLYFGLTLVCLKTYPAVLLATSSTPVTLVAGRHLGSIGVSIVAIGIMLATLSVVNAQLLVISRIISAIANDGFLPKQFVNFRVAITFAGSLLLIIISLFPQVIFLAQISSFVFVLVLLATNLAYLRIIAVNKAWLLPMVILAFLPAVFLTGIQINAFVLIVIWFLFGWILCSIAGSSGRITKTPGKTAQ